MFEFLFPYKSKLKTFYFEACMRGNVKFIECFSDTNLTIDSFDPFDYGIIESEHHVITKGCLESLLSINTKLDYNWTNEFGLYGCHCAAQYGQTNLIEYMWEHNLFPNNNIDIPVNNITTSTCLLLAAMNGHVSTVKYLVKHGANIDYYDYSQRTALHWAAQNHHLEIVQFLLEAGANPHLRTKLRQTAAEITNNLNIRREIRAYMDKDANTSQDVHTRIPIGVVSSGPSQGIAKTSIAKASIAKLSNPKLSHSYSHLE